MQTFTQILEKTIQEVPEKTAIHLLFSGEPEKTCTYRELITGSERCSQALQNAGVKPEEVVILILDHGEDLVWGFFGAVLCGAIPSIMPFLTEKLSPESYRKSLVSLFKITAPAAVITSQSYYNDVRAASRGTDLRCILINQEIKENFSLREQIDFQTMPGMNQSPDKVALLQHSSGTTGLQKGIALSHRAVLNQIDSYSRALRLTSRDVLVSWLPLYHDMGLIAGFVLPILKQIPLVIMSPFDWVRAPYQLLQSISDYQGTLSWIPNFAFNFCAQKIRDRDLVNVDLSSLRALINCSEPMYWKSHKMFLDRFAPYGLQSQSLATSYAMAENVFAVTQGGIESSVMVDIIDRQALNQKGSATPLIQPVNWENSLNINIHDLNNSHLKMLSAGRAIPDTKIRIIGKDGRNLPERQIGEIAIKSNCMLTGYYNRPELTGKSFMGGWYMTGDLGYLAGEELFVTGRKKDLIIVGGKNIYPQDLESLASEVKGIHPGRVAAFGIYNEKSGTEDVVLIAESDLIEDLLDEADKSPEIQQVADEIRDRITRGSDVTLRKVHIVRRNWLLKTTSGKVARNANREKYLTWIIQPE
jgi:fatty-acyl-CoA synthase